LIRLLLTLSSPTAPMAIVPAGYSSERRSGTRADGSAERWLTNMARNGICAIRAGTSLIIAALT